MATVQGQNRQVIRLGDGGNRDVGESGMPTVRSSFIAEDTGDPRRFEIKRQDAIAIPFEEPVKPRLKTVNLATRARPLQLCNAGDDLGGRNGG